MIKAREQETQVLTEGILNKRIFINQNLLEHLIRRCIEDQNGELTIDEVRLIARAFSSLPTEVIVQENLRIFDKSSVNAHEQRLQEEAI